MNSTNILNFITKANLSGINAINKQLAAQAQALANVARAGANAAQAARNMQAAWIKAGRALRQAQAARLNIGGAQGNQGRNARGQFMSPAATQAALANAARFSSRMRWILGKAWTVNTGAWQASIKGAFSSIGAAAAALGAKIAKALTLANIGSALKKSFAVAAAALASLMTNAAKVAGNAIKTLIGGALRAAMVPAKALAGVVRGIKGGMGNLGIGGALVAIGGIKAGYTVDKYLAKINTIARETKPNLDLIAQGLEQISFVTGTTFSDNAEAYYDLLSAGLGMKDGVVDIALSMQLMQDAANLAVGGIGSMSDSLDFMTTALNAFRGPLTKEFGDPLKASTVIADAFAKSVELGKVTVAELGPVFSTAAPLAAQLGVDFREMAAIVAVMTQQGFDAGEAFTALRSALVGAQRDSKKLQEAALTNTSVLKTMKSYGVKTWLELIDVAGFQVFATTLRKYSEESGVPLIKLLGRIEGVQAILGTTGSQAENYQYALEQVTNASGNAAEQATLFNDSLSAQLNLFKNALFAIGDALFRRRIIDPLKEFVRELNMLAGAIFQFVVSNEKLFNVLVPVFTLLTGLTALTKGASAIENIFLRLGGPISGFAIGIGRIGMALAWSLGPLLGAIVAYETLKRLIDYGILPAKTFGRVIADINVALANLGRAAGAAVDMVKEFFAIVFGDDQAAKNRPASAGIEARLDAMFKRFGTVIASSLSIAGAAVKMSIDDFVDSVQKFFGEGFEARAQAIGRSVLKALQSAWDWLAPRAAEALGSALTFGAEVLTNLVEFGAGVASALGQAIIDALPRAAEWIEGIPAAIGGSMAEGGILNTVLAQLEEWGRSVVGWFEDNGPALADGIVAVFQAIGTVLASEVPKALGKVGDFLGSVWDNIVANKDQILGKAEEIVLGVVDWMKKLVEMIVPPLAEAAGKMIDWITQDAIPAVAGAVARFIDEVVRNLVPLGKDGGRMEDGLTSAGGQLVSWITDRIPGALDALLNWLIEVENWILTVAAPRVAAVMLGLGVLIIEGLAKGLITAVTNPVDTIRTLAKLIYAALAAGVILKAAFLAGALVSGAYKAAILMLKFTGPMLAQAAVKVATALGGAVTTGAKMAMGTVAVTTSAIVAAALVAALAAIVVVAAVAIKIRTNIEAQGAALRDQVKEFVRTATIKGLRDAKAALADASNRLDIFLDLGLITGSARADIASMNAAIDKALLDAGAAIDPRPLPVRVVLAPVYSTMAIDPAKNKHDELQAYIDAHPMAPVTARLPFSLKLTGDTPEEIGARIRQFKGKFDLTETVTKFQEGTAGLVEEWNSLPERFKSQQELLREVMNKPFDLKGLVKDFKTNYALIAEAMRIGNVEAIVYAQQLAAATTEMARQTNAAFIAAGKAPPFLIDSYTGAVTLAAEASKKLKNAVITPVSAIPTAFTEAGAAAGTLAPAIGAVAPAVGAAATAVATAATTPLLPLPGVLSGLGTSSATGFVSGVNSGIKPTGTAANGLRYQLVTPLKPLPGIMTGFGTRSGSSFVSGFRTNIAPAGRAGEAVSEGVKYPLKPTKGTKSTLSDWGASISGSWIAGFISSIAGAATRIWNALINALLGAKGGSPPKVGPLQNIDVWGQNIGSAWVDGLVLGLETGPERVANAMRMVGNQMTTAMGTVTVPMAFGKPATPAYAATSTQTVAPQPYRRADESARRVGRTVQFGDLHVAVDARGAQEPRRVGQAVADSMAQVLREQTSRVPSRRRW